MAEVDDVPDHFSSEDIATWQETVQGSADALDETPAAEPVPDVPDDVAAKAAEWAGTVQGDADAAPAEAEPES